MDNIPPSLLFPITPSLPPTPLLLPESTWLLLRVSVMVGIEWSPLRGLCLCDESIPGGSALNCIVIAEHPTLIGSFSLPSLEDFQWLRVDPGRDRGDGVSLEKSCASTVLSMCVCWRGRETGVQGIGSHPLLLQLTQQIAEDRSSHRTCLLLIGQVFFSSASSSRTTL